MHEASIILSVLEIAQLHCNKEGFSRIDSIKLKIGRASGVLPDALLFAFEAAKADTPASGASLEIVETPVSGKCRECGREFTVDEKYIFYCTRCGSADVRVTGGRELDIMELEVS